MISPLLSPAGISTLHRHDSAQLIHDTTLHLTGEAQEECNSTNFIFTKVGKSELNSEAEKGAFVERNAAIKKGDSHSLHKKSIHFPGYVASGRCLIRVVGRERITICHKMQLSVINLSFNKCVQFCQITSEAEGIWFCWEDLGSYRMVRSTAHFKPLRSGHEEPLAQPLMCLKHIMCSRKTCQGSLFLVTSCLDVLWFAFV